MPNGQKEIQVKFPDHLQGGAYSNNMVVTHTKEEFVMDFLMVAPPAGSVTARVIVSPGHMKRILAALQENVSKYVAMFIMGFAGYINPEAAGFIGDLVGMDPANVLMIAALIMAFLRKITNSPAKI